MRIIIPVKQVPESSNVKMDSETGTMIRSGVESVVNPLDLYAIEVGASLRKQCGGTVTAVSMGPPSAAKALREAIAMGCDEGILLSDKKFGGADTWATSYTIAEAIKKMGSYDLIICGERATDGDTGQVGPATAAWLKIPVLSYVSTINSINDHTIVVERMIEEGYQKVRANLPAVLTVVKEIARPQLPTLVGKKRARQTEIPIWTRDTLELDVSKIGLKGSPTRVVKIETPKIVRTGRMISAEDEAGVAEAVGAMMNFFSENKVL
jgi:electron transfer flavoprotein beta subunit